MADLVALIESHYPCGEGREWLAKQHDPAQAWRDCPSGKLLLWYIEEVIAPPVGSELWKKKILATCACARTALDVIPSGEDRPRLAIETAEKYIRGECDRDELCAAYAAAYAAAYIDNAIAEVYAATAAARAAVACCGCCLAGVAAWAAAAWDEAASRHADIVREFFPEVMLPAKSTHCTRCGNSLRDDNECGLCWECEHE